jgi:hypothetical protein
VYAFYRYVKAPSRPRLLLVGLAAGLALASKHTGVLVFPILGLLALTELRRAEGDASTAGARLRRMAGALALVAALAVAILWAFYAFRYSARPAGLHMNPPFAEFVQRVPKPHQIQVLNALAAARVLPESYLYGLADVLFMDSIYTSYVLGRAYPHGVWFYFPVAFAVKSTLAFLLLPIAAAGAVALGRLSARREVLYLAIPPVFYLAVAMSARMNIGVRHILPLYVFLAVLGAGALTAFAVRDRRWRWVLAALVAVHVASSLRAFPNLYIPYANELWGGPSQTYRYLTDSNADWGQQLHAVKRHLDARGVTECWFAYFAQGTADVAHYGVPCKPLPTSAGFWLKEPFDPPEEIEGTVLISAGILSGFEYGAGALDPYAQFRSVTPAAQIDGGVFVFEGRFRIPLAAALARAERADALLAAGHVEQALALSESAVALAPESVRPNVVAGDVLAAAGRKDGARLCYETALRSAKTIEPEYQGWWAGILEQKLAGLGS